VLLYNDKTIDVTEEVIKRHNANPNRARGMGKRVETPPPAGGE